MRRAHAPFRAGSHAWRRHRDADYATALRHGSWLGNRHFSLHPAIVPDSLVCGAVGGHPSLYSAADHRPLCVNAWTESLPSSIP